MPLSVRLKRAAMRQRVHALPPVLPGTVVVYADGAALRNGQRGARAGIGVWFGPGDARNVSRPLGRGKQTNNAAEATAALEAVRAVPPDVPLCVRTDSQYVVNAVHVWRFAWQRRVPAWDRVANADVLRALSDAVDARRARTDFQYVPGHAGVRGNEAADRLARAGATAAAARPCDEHGTPRDEEEEPCLLY